MGAAISAEDFADLTAYTRMPRVGSLALSPDGTRLVAVVAELSADGKTWQGALWELDPTGRRPARRLTRGAKGESNPVFTPSGDLLFLSGRPNQEAKPGDTGVGKDKTALWLLPPVGEARELFRPAGGVDRVVVSGETGTLLLTAGAHPGGEFGHDGDLRKAREDAGVTAILHESYPVRYWDSDLGPAYPRLLTGTLDAEHPDSGRLDTADLVDLTPESATRLDDAAAISPDGRWVVHTERVEVSASYGARVRLRLVAADGSSGRVLADQDGHSFMQVAFLPDSSGVVAVRALESTADRVWRNTLVRISLTGEITELAADLVEEVEHPVVAPDGRAVYFTAAQRGHQPIFRLDLATSEVVRLTASGAYTEVIVGRDHVYALRSAWDHPPQPVRLELEGADQEPVALPAPGAVASLPGTLTEVSTVVEDGRTVRAWLVLPSNCSADNPAPLLLWVHGGPIMSWNAWSWRWNPWLMAARGYAVLLPDPALSLGYGQEFIQAGWGSWGAKPYTDLMAITDVTVRRPDVDDSRTAAMGGSFGGYMANWIATQTDRFKAIVTHASLWHLDAFTGTTDASYYWIREVGDPQHDDERVRANSPHLRVADIKTPMLVIHGDKDYRVPVGEGQRLFFDLVRHGVPAKFLYFPTENHWILTPGNTKVWYETIFAFLAEHVLGEPWQRPDLL
ncbi:alpha/beta hydrolase family protein [Saccharothrix variisporea]|uniref:Dipeptidyl aminopeptidase/acylaminoacyl peptidase n=2 Tax=Saccharothrix variisporea TaxID=543527 RepID=A0A495X848_9PSEU|nr:S9 family peptidase [Saccharothrix variisporea]RKT69739.1 dipeptidyl aminopeptidase/acylaminoacyl peptidase [Saccharothrix variisporea]